ncbi:MAG: helix-turn-helix domain-containing protein [Actinobacteria bacterium]|nr:helix-turn-helix domain-containing protein [Actinomycetota bacterium]
MAKSSASQLENGHSNPTLATLVEVVDALEVSLHDLLRM